jgi:nucleotide-binding universal stress UspA family protein
VTGVFLENLVPDEKEVMEKLQTTKYFDWRVDESSPEADEKIKAIENNIALFKEACDRRAVQFEILRDDGVPAAEIIAESRYADVVVTDAATSFKKVFERTPTHFVNDILKDAECPVIIAPGSFEGIERIIFTYDGTRSSAFAMKQFTYLFPQFEDKCVTVFHVNDGAEWTAGEKRKLTRWLQNRYSAIGFETVEGNASDELLSYLLPKRKVLIIMGAYGRSEFSMLLKRSHADVLLKSINQPIFIAHC